MRPRRGGFSFDTHNGKPRKFKGLRRMGRARGDGGARVAEAVVAAVPALAVSTGDLAPPDNEESVPPTPGVELLYPVQKKVWNLNEKVRNTTCCVQGGISLLAEGEGGVEGEGRTHREHLEATQKIESRAEIRKELWALTCRPELTHTFLFVLFCGP